MKYILALGLLALLAFVGFIGATSLTARAEHEFGPPSPALSAFQRWRVGIELGLRADELLEAEDPSATVQRFEIGLGEPTDQIVSRLWAADLIREGNLFSNYLIYTGHDTQLQAGSYQLSAAMSSVELATALLDPTPGEVTLVILPGWRLEEIAAALPFAGLAVTPEEFLTYALSTPNELAVNAEMPIGSSLEGFLLAGSYEVDRNADVIGLLLTLLNSPVFSETMTSERIAGFDQHGLSIYDALVLASIVEREAVTESEMPLIASVFLNRLAAGMRLDADPTVQYAVGYDAITGSWWKTPLTSADLAVDSPYNTYLYGGLPPAPIAAPSAAALHAVAFPASSGFFYFQAACDGSGTHVFTVTYEEHLANNCP